MGVGVTWYCRTCKVYKAIPYGSYHNLERRLAEHVPHGHETHDTLTTSNDWDYGMEGGKLYGMGPYGTRGDVLIDFTADEYQEAK
jgi:hypothetical protein